MEEVLLIMSKNSGFKAAPPTRKPSMSASEIKLTQLAACACLHVLCVCVC